MKAKEIQQLIDFIANSGIDEVNIETDEFKLSVKKNSSPVVLESASGVVAAAPQPAAPNSTTQAQAPSPEAKQESQEAKKEEKGNYVEIKSPMIGTFYRSANPDSPPYVSVGDKVEVGQTICIVEAMKLFNEIEAEVSGTIVKVLAENSSPVEYDQPLFLIDPS